MASWALIPSILVVLGTFTLWFLCRWPKSRNHRLPPGPLNWPVIGGILSLEPKLHHAFAKLAKKYGPIFHLRVGTYDVVVVSSVELAEEVLKHKDAEFAQRPTTIQRLAMKFLGFGATNISSQGYTPNQVFLKKICTAEFLTASRLKQYEQVCGQLLVFISPLKLSHVSHRIQFTADWSPLSIQVYWKASFSRPCLHLFCTWGDDELFMVTVQLRKDEMAATLRAISIKAQAGEIVDVRNMLLTTTNGLLATMLFGKRFLDGTLSVASQLRDFKEIVAEILELLLCFNVVDLFPGLERLDPQGLVKKFKNLNKRLRDIFEQVLKEHRDVRASLESYVDEDFVDILLTHHENQKITEDGIISVLLVSTPISTKPTLIDDQFRYFFRKSALTDLLYNYPTTSISFVTSVLLQKFRTEWSLLELVRYPHLLKRLQDEIDSVVGRERAASDSDFSKMPFLQAVISETFRVHSPLPLLTPHSNFNATTLGGYYIPAHSAVFVNCLSISRDPKLWQNPLAFDPDRFMGKNGPIGANDFKLLPFGSGRRKCAGVNLGLLMFQRMLVSLLQEFDWCPPPGLSPLDVPNHDGFGLVVQTALPLRLHPTPRLAFKTDS
ncbi:hypothetical protein Mapa_001253 [Marchantia paleacea]|nr:hypothetical protein Mapa_001253 [Marchantia paleacea]